MESLLERKRDPKLIEKIKTVYAKKQKCGWDDRSWKDRIFSKTEKKVSAQ